MYYPSRRCVPERTIVRVPRLLSSCAYLVMLAACGGDSGSVAGPVTPVATVTVSPGSVDLLHGQTTRLQARGFDSGGEAIAGLTFSWSTSDPSVASVDEFGRVTAVGAGTATITATTGGKVGTAAVTVAVISFASASSGDFHTCGITTTGKAYCWGSNFAGQLGLGSGRSLETCGPGNTSCSTFPLAVAGSQVYQAVSASWSSTCALSTAGEAYCWGSNQAGQVGDGTFSDRSAPAPVAGGLTFASISVGGGNICALTLSGEAYCWGSNDRGQLGDGAFSFSQPAPVADSGGLTFSSIDAGGLVTCGVSTGGRAYCWGSNQAGQVGDGTFSDRSAPAPVAGGLTFSAISAQARHACGLTTNGRAYCWGLNRNGQLGDRTTTDARIPVAVLGGPTFSSISVGGSFTCGLTTTGKAYCWGLYGAGQLGTGGSLTQAGCAGNCSITPTPVSGDLRFVSISAGGNITCGLSTDGVLYCWGSNDSGGVGDGTTTDRFSPVRVLGSG